MLRRDLLRLLGGASLIVGLTPDELLAVGRETHRRLHGERTPIGFFDPHQLHTVAAAGDRIMPDTDTPGAMAARCERFTERIVADHYDTERQRRFVLGLVDLDQRAARIHQKLFVNCAAIEQDSVLAAVEGEAYAAHAEGADSFWRDLKFLTLYGYYTSEVGMREELKTPKVPGRWDGCAPATELAG